MKKENLIKILICFFMSINAYGANYFTLMGGGGEPDGEATIFDEWVNEIKPNQKLKNWNITAAYNGGHPQSEGMLKKDFSKSAKPLGFSRENYFKTVEQYIDKIKNGSIKKGDQIFIQFASHGQKKMKGEASHGIALSDTTTKLPWKKPEFVSLDNLQRLVDIAEQNGVKLAIADFSCYSGGIHTLKTTNTCLISSTSEEDYGYGGVNSFPFKFNSKMRPGKNLEELFLEARYDSHTPEYPMISTEEARLIDEYLYPKLTAFYQEIYNTVPENFYLPKNGFDLNKDQFVCRTIEDVVGIQNILKVWKEIGITTKGFVSDEDVRILKFKLNRYSEILLDAFYQYYKFKKILEGADLILKSELSAQVKETKVSSAEELFFSNYEQSILKYTKSSKNTPFSKLMIQNYNKKIQLRENLLKKLTPEERALVQNMKKDSFSYRMKVFSAGSSIEQEVREQYNRIYNNISESKKSNPCRNFEL